MNGMEASAPIGYSFGARLWAFILNGLMLLSMTVLLRDDNGQLQGICLDKPSRSLLAWLEGSWNMNMVSEVSTEAFQLITPITDIQEPIRGASLFAARRQRQRAAGQIRQPQAIVPNFRTQEYVQQYQ